MTMRKIIAIIIVASILSGCGANAAPSKPETAVEADTSEAAQADTSEAAQADTSEVAQADTSEVDKAFNATIICDGYTISVEGSAERVDITYDGGEMDGFTGHSEGLSSITGEIMYDDLPSDWKDLLMKSRKMWEYINNK